MFGNITNPANENLPDLNAREFATLLPLVFLAFWIGIYPAPLFKVLDRPVQRIVETVNPWYYAPPSAAPSLPPAAPPLISPSGGTNPASNVRPADTHSAKEGK
jgi:NADH-quinone oxidoreductase subunit M